MNCYFQRRSSSCPERITFLILLHLQKRIGELQAPSMKVGFSVSDEFHILSTRIISKMDSTSNFSKFVQCACFVIANGDNVHKVLLCLVRAMGNTFVEHVLFRKVVPDFLYP